MSETEGLGSATASQRSILWSACFGVFAFDAGASARAPFAVVSANANSAIERRRRTRQGCARLLLRARSTAKDEAEAQHRTRDVEHRRSSRMAARLRDRAS